ncbi:MAG TPA: 3'-5' exonuclease [Candidatus Nanopelagicaceae bacterium]
MSWLGKISRLAKSDLDSNWRDINYCAIDLETTGLNFKTDEIISIGAVQIESGRIIAEANYYREVRPKQIPSPSSIRVHGIRAVDLEHAPPLEGVLPEFAERLRGRVVIAHAGWVENAFLKDHLADINLDFSKRLIDTAGLARTCGVVEVDLDHEPSLEHLAKTLNLPAYSPHHALGDALTTAIIFLALATELERRKREKGRSILTLGELLKLSAKSARTQW